MNFNLDVLVKVIIVVIVVLALFWLMGMLLIGIPVLIMQLIKFVIVLAAIIYVARLIGLGV